MKIHELKSNHRNKTKKRVGRGTSGAGGKTAGRGTKGQKARTNINPRFEGGQTPLVLRLPKKRGFKSLSHKFYFPLNIEKLNIFNDDEEVTIEKLQAMNLVPKQNKFVKILGQGILSKKLNVRAHKFSQSAKKAILDLGGTIKEINA